MIDLPLLFLVLAAAGVAALNPCTIGVLIMLTSTVLGRGRSSSRMFWLGMCFVGVLFATSAGLGLAALYLFNLLPLSIAHYVILLIGLIVIIAGLIEIKDYFWYGQGMSLRIAKQPAALIRSVVKRKMSFGKVMAIGFFVSIVALPCMGAPYLATIMLLHGTFDTTSVVLLLLYNAVFVLPLVLLLIVIASGVKVSAIQRWKEESKGKMRLGVGLLVIALGWTLMLIASGVLNFG
jgi:cytochrome c biogenesis protein CcdA